MKPIEKPSLSVPGPMGWQISPHDFSLWFKEHVEPLNEALRKGEVVFGRPSDDMTFGFDCDPSVDTHKALLICVEEIEQESLEDVLRDLVNNVPAGEYSAKIDEEQLAKIIERAKRALEKKR